jgi:hypothetical protein
MIRRDLLKLLAAVVVSPLGLLGRTPEHKIALSSYMREYFTGIRRWLIVGETRGSGFPRILSLPDHPFVLKERRFHAGGMSVLERVITEQDLSEGQFSLCRLDPDGVDMTVIDGWMNPLCHARFLVGDAEDKARVRAKCLAILVDYWKHPKAAGDWRVHLSVSPLRDGPVSESKK